MTKFSFVAVALCLILVGSANAAPIVVGSGPLFNATHLTGTINWTSNNTYQIKGWVFVDSLAVLNIQAGTVIYGDKLSGSSLIIRRGAKIIANGSAGAPIVFTSFEAAGSRAPGDWGGVIILGKATTNRPTTQQIEGGFTQNAPGQTQYGGTDDDDSSGVFRYVRIEYPGYNYSTDDEINGLTLGGVGRKTVIDHVQVSYSNDDDFEFFGGTVDAKYLVSWRSRDDQFDTDFGYNGRLQFLYAKRDVNIFGLAANDQSNGFESDNENSAATGHSALPRTKTRVSNATLIGPYATVAAARAGNLTKWQHEALIRRASELSIYNSMLCGWPFGPTIRDTATQGAAVYNRLEIRNTSFGAGQGTATILAAVTTTPNSNPYSFDSNAVVTWFNGLGKNNFGSAPREWGPGSAMNFSAAAFNLDATNDPVPGSGEVTAGSALDGRLTGDTWFTATSYRGAFDPAVPMASQWTAGWTNFAPELYNPEVVNVTTAMNNGWNLVSVPNVPASFATSGLFPTAVSGTVNSFLTGTYTQPATLVNGEGYWAFYSAATSNSISGSAIATSSVTVPTGNRWVLVGSVTGAVPASALTSNPPGAIVGGTLYGWNGTSYAAPTTLEPGKGYWVFVNAPCTLTVGP
jgi:hypothetical protein